MQRFKLASTIVDETRKRKQLLSSIDEISNDVSSSSHDDYGDSDYENSADDSDDDVDLHLKTKHHNPKRSKHSAPILWDEINNVNEDEQLYNWSFYQKYMTHSRPHMRWYMSCHVCKQDIQYKGRISIEQHVFSKSHQKNTGQKKRKLGIVVVDEM